MFLHPQRQRLDPRENEKRVEWRERRTKVAQTEHAASNGKREIPKRLLDLDSVIFRTRLAQHRIFVALRPVEGARIDDDSADRIAMSAQELGQRMNDDVGAMVNGADQVWGS